MLFYKFIFVILSLLENSNVTLIIFKVLIFHIMVLLTHQVKEGKQ